MSCYDHETVARNAGISTELLHKWHTGFVTEYPGDEMMTDLRQLRACNAAALGPQALADVVHALEEEYSQFRAVAPQI